MKSSVGLITYGRYVLLALIVAFSAGCTATGASFSERPAPPGKSLIYVYRDGGVLGAARAWDLYANNRYITKIENGGYYDFVVDPGHIVFAAEAAVGAPIGVVDTLLERAIEGKVAAAVLEAKADQTYYFKSSINDFLIPVTREEAIHAMIGKHRFDGP